MSPSNPMLRLVQELEAEAIASPMLSLTESAAEIAPVVDQQIQNLQEEIASLNAEIEALRRRDETVKFYMHRIDEEMRLAAQWIPSFPAPENPARCRFAGRRSMWPGHRNEFSPRPRPTPEIQMQRARGY